MGHNGAIEINTYEPWMLDDLAVLRCKWKPEETIDSNKALIEHQFFHDFSKNRSLIIVAKDGQKIVGMQTYTYWPYSYSGETFYSVQSGLTLVDEDYWGKGIFLRMLEKGNELLLERGIDFITGFPGPMSFGGFMKDGWSNIGTPMFMIRPLKPRKLLTYKSSSEENSTYNSDWVDNQSSLHRRNCADLVSRLTYRIDSEDAICLKADEDFIKYRYGEKEGKYKIYGYGEGQQEIIFICKMFFFGSFNALGIGDIQVADTSCNQFGKALVQLIKDVRDEGNIDAIAILIKSRKYRAMKALLGRGFLPYPSQRTPFIVKPICLKSSRAELVRDYSQWSIMLSDKDTWYIRGIYAELQGTEEYSR